MLGFREETVASSLLVGHRQRFGMVPLEPSIVAVVALQVEVILVPSLELLHLLSREITSRAFLLSRWTQHQYE